MTQANPSFPRSDAALIGAFACLKLFLHLPFLGRWGFHHDELYFLACGRHLAFGYVDHSPMVPWIARLSEEFMPGSLVGMRMFSLLAGVAVVVLTALLTRRLGGGRFAQVLACLTMITAPVFLRVNGLLCIPAFEILFWIGGSYLAMVAVDEKRPRLWLAVGLLAGLGLMTKHSLLFFGFGLAVAIVLTPARRALATPWLFAGGALAFVIFLPNLLWQIANGWPTLEFFRQINEHTMSGISPFQFLAGQVLYLGPATASVWLAGLAFFFATDIGRRFRLLGIIYVAVLILLMVLKSKIYYLAPAYPPLIAGGAVLWERVSESRRWLRTALPALVVVGGLALVPLSLPIMPLPTTERFVETVTFGAFEDIFELTGDLRGMFAWEERVDAIAEVYHALPAEEREKTSIYAGWYGPAGAIDLFGPARGLPSAASEHMSYHLWGPPSASLEPAPLETLIAVNTSVESMSVYFEEVTVAKEMVLENVNPWDRVFRVLVCRRPKVDLRERWPELGRYY